MNSLPLLGPYQLEDPIARYHGQIISCTTFLSHVVDSQRVLPERPHVLNLCTDRYQFLVGFAAALLRGQTTLLPPSRTPHVVAQIAEAYAPCYGLIDGHEKVEGIENLSLPSFQARQTHSTTIPLIPDHHAAVIAFTSGSTGMPRPNAKTWESLVRVAQKTGSRILEKHEGPLHVVATVPHQHMYGLETSIMLPIQFGWSFHSGRPFYPEDIRAALSEMPGKRLLVSTPIHLRACSTQYPQLPDLQCVLSATAPLSNTLAQNVETQFHTHLMEIYGFAEAGTIATRRTTMEKTWKLLDGLSLVSVGNDHAVDTPYFQTPIRIPDSISPHGLHQFDLQGRPGNLINIGGHRASLEDLNFQLTSIEGVEDGVFYMPENQENTVTRLMAFAVAPGKTQKTILSSLRKKIDPVFLPRPLYLVDSLPRNSTGKLPFGELKTLADQQGDRQDIEKYPF